MELMLPSLGYRLLMSTFFWFFVSIPVCNVCLLSYRLSCVWGPERKGRPERKGNVPLLSKTWWCRTKGISPVFVCLFVGFFFLLIVKFGILVIFNVISLLLFKKKEKRKKKRFWYQGSNHHPFMVGENPYESEYCFLIKLPPELNLNVYKNRISSTWCK